MDTRIIGVDPGSRAAGIALLVGHNVTAWWAISRVTHGYRVRTWRGMALVRDSLAEAVTLVTDSLREPVDLLVVESEYVPGRWRGRSRQSVLKLAESAGEILAVLRRAVADPTAIERPSWSTWSRSYLGSCRVRAARAEALAVQVAQRRLGWPAGLPGRLTLAEEGAVCEAALMAAWALEGRLECHQRAAHA